MSAIFILTIRIGCGVFKTLATRRSALRKSRMKCTIWWRRWAGRRRFEFNANCSFLHWCFKTIVLLECEELHRTLHSNPADLGMEGRQPLHFYGANMLVNPFYQLRHLKPFQTIGEHDLVEGRWVSPYPWRSSRKVSLPYCSWCPRQICYATETFLWQACCFQSLGDHSNIFGLYLLREFWNARSPLTHFPGRGGPGVHFIWTKLFITQEIAVGQNAPT